MYNVLLSVPREEKNKLISDLKDDLESKKATLSKIKNEVR